MGWHADTPSATAGSAYNQAGRSSGLTAPNGPAQSALVRKALAASLVQPHQVSMVSVHGTGTPLGDPIEVGALGQSMAASAQRPASLALGMRRLRCLPCLYSARLACSTIRKHLQAQHMCSSTVRSHAEEQLCLSILGSQ